MVTNGHLQIANGMWSDGMGASPGRLGVPGGPARAAESARCAGPRHDPLPPTEDLESPEADEYPLIASVLLVNKKLRQRSVRIIAARMMAD
jgi:hypothetical protein